MEDHVAWIHLQHGHIAHAIKALSTPFRTDSHLLPGVLLVDSGGTAFTGCRSRGWGRHGDNNARRGVGIKEGFRCLLSASAAALILHEPLHWTRDHPGTFPRGESKTTAFLWRQRGGRGGGGSGVGAASCRCPASAVSAAVT